MRCARCDRLAIPQAVGHSPEGLVVFGWCLHCLEEAGCTDIEVVKRPRVRHSLIRPVLTLEPTGLRVAANRWSRRKAILGVAAILGGWSLVLLAIGSWSIQRPPPPNPSPLGNGTPMLFLTGGAATAVTALVLLGLSQGRALLASRRACGWVQSGSFLLALAILVVGILFHDPRRDPFVVAAAGLALTLSIGANWQQRRLSEPPLRSSLMKDEQIQRPS